VVLIDMPISTLSKYSQLLTQIDSIALCVNNNLYPVISTVRTVEDLFVKEDLVLFTVKSRPVLTNITKPTGITAKLSLRNWHAKLYAIGGYNSDLTPAGIVPYSREI